MTEAEFKNRTKQFALRVVRVVEVLPSTKLGRVITDQLIRSSTSVAANYRASCRAKSTADMIAKLSIVEEEADESIFWMEFAIDAGLFSQTQLGDLISEANQIEAMIVASIKTLRAKINHPTNVQGETRQQVQATSKQPTNPKSKI